MNGAEDNLLFLLWVCSGNTGVGVCTPPTRCEVLVKFKAAMKLLATLLAAYNIFGLFFCE